MIRELYYLSGKGCVEGLFDYYRGTRFLFRIESGREIDVFVICLGELGEFTGRYSFL